MTHQTTNLRRINHGTISRPFAKYNTPIDSLMPFYPTHWHEEVEIIRVQSGSGNINVAGRVMTLKQDDILIIPPYVMHTIVLDSSVNMCIDTVVFNMRLLDYINPSKRHRLNNYAPMLNNMGNIACLLKASTDHNQAIGNIINDMHYQDNHHYAYQSLAHSVYHILDILRTVTTSAQPATINADAEKKLYIIKKVIRHIHANYNQTITIEDMSVSSGYSTFYIMKLFKQYTNSSIIDYTNGVRLDIIANSLLTSNTDISTLAQQAGYNNISYFNRQFLKQYGTTPKLFRANYAITD